MCCARIKAQIPAYVDGALAPAEERALEGHIAECRACRAELAAMRHSLEALRAVASAAPPLDLWPAVQQRLVRDAPGIQCRQAVALLPAYLEGAVAPAAAAAVHRHLAVCRRCQVEHGALLNALGALESLSQSVGSPPIDLWPALRERIIAESARRLAGPRLTWQPVAVAVALIAAVVGGWAWRGASPLSGSGPETAAVVRQVVGPRVARTDVIPPERRASRTEPDAGSLAAQEVRRAAVPRPSVRCRAETRQPVRRSRERRMVAPRAREAVGEREKWTAPRLQPGERVELAMVPHADPLEGEARTLVATSLVAGSQVIRDYQWDANNIGSLLMPGRETTPDIP
ncbi:MAG: zf-HC2 domain-containing protein [Armatimonadetes bacterium]|nr:zf-HC2 domain-containing protein [Armatimonadota bacterium]